MTRQKILFNEFTVFLRKRINILLIIMTIITIVTQMNLDYNSINFLRDNMQFAYIYMVATVAFFSIGFYVINEKHIYKLKFLLLGVMFLLSFGLEKVADYSSLLNIPMIYIYDLHFVRVILETDDSPFWLIGIIIIMGVLLLLRVLLLRMKNKKISLQYKVVMYPIIVYILLLPFIWMVTHFTYVGSNWVYMNVHTNTVLELMREDKNRLEVYKEFKTMSEITKYYEDSNFGVKEKEQIIKVLRKVTFDKQENSSKGYLDVSNFNEWMDYVFNQSASGVTKDNYYYTYEIIFPAEYDGEELKHLIVVLKKVKDKIGVVVVLDNSFKKLKKNYIFNVMYMLYNFLYLLLFMYVYSIHKVYFRREK